MSEPVIVQSARRHGIADDDMLHAFRSPIRIIELDGLVVVERWRGECEIDWIIYAHRRCLLGSLHPAIREGLVH